MNKQVWDYVTLAREIERPTATYYIEQLIHQFYELKGDRYFADDHAIIGGIGYLGHQKVTVIAIEKGRDTAERIHRNFGMVMPEGYRKALRLMKQAEKFKRPIIILIDTAGAYPGVEAEARGQGQAIANNLFEMCAIKVPIISVIIGEGGSGGALALAVSNQVWMLENAIYSILSPEGFATILWKDGSRAKEAAELMKLTAPELLQLGIVDKVFYEKNKDFKSVAIRLADALERTLKDEMKKSPKAILKQRQQRFRKYGLL